MSLLKIWYGMVAVMVIVHVGSAGQYFQFNDAPYLGFWKGLAVYAAMAAAPLLGLSVLRLLDMWLPGQPPPDALPRKSKVALEAEAERLQRKVDQEHRSKVSRPERNPCPFGGTPVNAARYGPGSMCPACGAVMDVPAPWEGKPWPEHKRLVGN